MPNLMNQWDIQRSFDYKSYKCGIIQDGDHYELCFGIADYGERQFTLNYTITGTGKDAVIEIDGVSFNFIWKPADNLYINVVA